MSLAKLSIDLEARLANLQAGLDKAGLLAEQSAARIEGTFAGMGAAFKALAGTLAAGLSVAGITAFIRSTADGLDKLNDLKDATGASVENLSALEDIAIRTGTSMDTAGDAVIKLNKALNAAVDPKSDAAGALTALGLSLKDLQALDPVEALLKIGQALNGFADNGAKGRIELVLLGKGTRELAPLLKDLAEAGRLNATVTSKQTEEAERFNKSLYAMEKNSIDLARAISGPLITALADLFERLNKAAQNKRTWAQILGVPDTPPEIVFGGPDAIERRISGITALLKNQNVPIDYRLAKERELAGLLEERQRRLEDRGFRPKTEDPRPKLPDQVGGGGGRKVKDINLGASPISEAMQAALSAIEQTDTVKIDKINAALDELFKMRGSGIGGGAEIDDAVRKLRDELEKLSPAAQQAAEDKKRLDALLGKTTGRQLAAGLDDVAFLNAQFDAGKIKDIEDWEQAVTKATAVLHQQGEETKVVVSEWDTFANQAARNIQDALGNTLQATLSGHFENIGQMWRDLLIRMAAEAAAAQIGKQLFGDFGKTGNIGGWIGELLKLAPTLASERGNAFAGGVHAFAAGGILGPMGGLLTRPTVFPMANGGIGIGGEAGTEAVMPLARTRGGKLGVQTQGGGGRSIVVQPTINVHIDSRTDAAVVGQLVAQGVQEGQRQMLEYLRAGGVLQ